MTFPAVADADPDPTTQIAWPSARPKCVHQAPPEGIRHAQPEQRDNDGLGDILPSDVNLKIGKRHLSTWNLITLSISMAGAQIAWTVELG
jgi:solute carrier family 45 protein 1/2/4